MEPLDLIEVHSACEAKSKQLGWENLAVPERVLVLGMHFYMQTTTCGLEQFYRDRVGERAEETVWALEQLKAHNAVYLLALCNSLFPGGQPPTHVTDRSRLVRQLVASGTLPEKARRADALEWEEVYDLLLDYLDAHEKHFRKHKLTGQEGA